MTDTNAYLLPDRHPQQELFLCDVADAVLKDDMASMSNPFFALSKKPDKKIRRFESGDDWLEVIPSVKGIATIYDKDILIYAISQLIAKINKGKQASKRIKIIAKDLLIFINRNTGGKDYECLYDALDRLDGTRIRTNIKTGGEEETKGFGLIDEFRIVRSEKSQRILEIELSLSDWVFRSIEKKEVLTLHYDYFRLKKPLERRIYEIARKHCGQQKEWRIGIDKLKNRSGSQASIKEFRRLLRNLIAGDHLPDYSVSQDRGNVIFKRRIKNSKHAIRIKAETYHLAKKVAPGWDVYALYNDWLDYWVSSGRPTLKNSDNAFIAFCKHRND